MTTSTYGGGVTGIPRRQRVTVRCDCGRRLAMVAWTTRHDVGPLDVNPPEIDVAPNVVRTPMLDDLRLRVMTGQQDTPLDSAVVVESFTTGFVGLRLRCPRGCDNALSLVRLHRAWLYAVDHDRREITVADVVTA